MLQVVFTNNVIANDNKLVTITYTLTYTLLRSPSLDNIAVPPPGCWPAPPICNYNYNLAYITQETFTLISNTKSPSPRCREQNCEMFKLECIETCKPYKFSTTVTHQFSTCCREREVAGSNPGSSWVAAGGSWVSFHPGFIPRFLTCWSTDPNSNLSPVEKPPRYGNTAFVLPVGPST